ncbi:MAG: AAA family ATPase [Gammaproteobacteria bacterium]
MTRQLSGLEWAPITGVGEALLQDVVDRQWNETARKYRAKQVPIPERSTATPRQMHLLDADALTSIAPIRWRVQGLLPESGIAAIFGPSGSAKSFLALDLLLSVAGGRPWFGCRTKPCPVVYVCLEGEAGLSKRVGAYRSRCAVNGNAYFLVEPFSLTRPDDLDGLARAIRMMNAIGGITLIDTLNRAAPGLDENSSADMGSALAAVKNLQMLTAGLVVLVHHTGKDASKGMRGHSSLFAALDAAIEVRRSADHREWLVAKSKDGEDGHAHAFRLEVVDLGQDDEGEPISSCVIRAGAERAASKPLTTSQRRGVDTFLAAAALNPDSDDAAPHAHLKAWRDEFYRTSTADNLEAKRKAFTRVRAELVDLNKLVVSSEIYRLPTAFGPVPGHGT